MSRTPVKAVAVFDRRENPWFSEQIIDDQAIDCRLVDVEEFLSELRRGDRPPNLVGHKLDVVLLDSTLPSSYLLKTALRLRELVPDVPVLLLPQLHAECTRERKSALDANDESNRIEERGQTLLKTIRYARTRQRLQLKLLQLALKDELTGLQNRRGFEALAKQHLRTARTLKRHLLLFFVDVDGLKDINDRYGHHEGDRALMRTAASLKKTFRNRDVTARVGGDEFIAVAFEERRRSAPDIIAKLQLNLQRRAAEEPRYPLSVSIGVARFDPCVRASLHELMVQADGDLYAHKHERRRSLRAHSRASAKNQRSLMPLEAVPELTAVATI